MDFSYLGFVIRPPVVSGSFRRGVFRRGVVSNAPLSEGTVLCTHKRDFATVTLIPGRCFDRGGGGGGIGFYNNRGEEQNFSIFPTTT